MELSADLLKRFVHVTNDKEPKKKETTVYGTVVKNGESTYVKLDGSSNTLTPAFLGVCADNNDRVIVNIKNHSATITNNLTSPPKTGIYSEILNENFNIITGRIASIEIITSKAITTDTLSAALVDAGYISAEEIHSEYIRADELVSKIATIDTLTAGDAFIRNIQTVALNADYIKSAVADVGYLTADSAVIKGKLDTNQLSAEVAKLGYLTADNAVITSLQTGKLDTSQLSAEVAKLGYLDASMANIDFANLNKSNIGQLFANVGLISSATITDGHVTGYLDSVEVNANKITAGTLAVDRLLIKDSSGNYKMATYDSSGNIVTTTVNGSVITNRTITADHLVAGTITANEINMTNLVGNSAFINAINTNSIVVSASNNASSALSTANTANTNASNALNTANSANTTANSASSTANSALSTANTANSNASSAISTANTANTKAQGIIDNIYTPNTTTINGGKITTGSIKAAQIDVNDLFAQNITASGTITGATLKGAKGKFSEFLVTTEGRENHNYAVFGINELDGYDEIIKGIYIDQYTPSGYCNSIDLFGKGGIQITVSEKISENSYQIISGILLGIDGTTKLSGKVSVSSRGTFSSPIIYENGTALSNKYAPISHSHDDKVDKWATAPTDLDNAITPGCYRVNSGHANSPSDWGQLLVIRGGSDTITQIYGDYESGKLFTRSGNPSTVNGGGTWRGWYELISSNTIGSQSVYEATLLNTSNIAGYYTDVYGNLNHKQAVATDYFQIHNYYQTKSLKYFFETGQTELPGLLSIKTTSPGNWDEGIRIHQNGSWATIMLCGNDNTGDSGTSPNSWSIHNNDGNFHITRNGASTSSSAILSCVNNVWSVNGNSMIHSGNISSQSVNYANSAGSAPASDVYSWAKQSTKPSYAWSEISDRPTALSSFTNDSGYITHNVGYMQIGSASTNGYIDYYYNKNRTRMTANTGLASAITVRLPSTGGTLALASSDVRLKDNVDDSVVNAIDLIKKIKIRQFDWNDNSQNGYLKNTHQDIGFIADELEELDKRLALGGGFDTEGEMNVKTVDTFYLLGYVVKALQDIIDLLDI